MPPRWIMPTAAVADPCAICVTVASPDACALPHVCSLTLTRPAFSLSVATADGITDAYPCAFTRALRDA